MRQLYYERLTLSLAAFVCLVVAPLVTAQYANDADADEIIRKYRAESAPDQVAAWSRWSRTAADPAPTPFRDAAAGNFPASWSARRSTDAALIKDLQSLLAPVLTLYHQDYTLYVIETRTPAILIDSGSILVISTGLLSRIQSDDELLGFVAHEVAHAFFSQRSVAAKELYASLLSRGAQDSAGAKAALRSLARIELECDAVAARTLLVLRLNPREFIASVERINSDFPTETTRPTELGVDWHPTTQLRRRVVEALADKGILNHRPRRSSLLQGIQGRLHQAATK